MKISECITDLAAFKTAYGDIDLGHIGHYGEFYDLDRMDVRIVTVAKDETLSPIKEKRVVAIDVPYIGPEPD